MTRRYAYWDDRARTMSDAFPTLLDAFTARTSGFDQFDGLSESEQRKLAFEYQRRYEYWTYQADTTRFWMIVIAAILVLLLALALLALLIREIGVAAVLGTVILVAAMLGASALHHFLRMGSALRRKRCPDCRYDLSGSTPAVDPSALEGGFIGPRTCPECGSPWPLLPAPITGET